MEILLLLLICGVESTLARARTLKLMAEQSDGTLDGLGCAIADPMRQSGGKFDPQTKTCTKLDNSFFDNPTFVPNNNYFKLMELENLGPKSILGDTIIPTIILPGGTVTFYLETTSTPMSATVWMGIFFVNLEFTNIGGQMFGTIAMSNVIGGTEYRINSYVNNAWGSSEHLNNLCTQPNTAYKLDIRLMAHQAQVSVDDIPFCIYSQRTSLSMYGRVLIADKDNMVYKRIVFKY